ncbi:MAG: hypothetical protein LBR19_08660, partial [Bifidobacteriaceae bacterium]|nr:hypothetical protein [Bifidobacteriaceae bacterium]
MAATLAALAPTAAQAAGTVGFNPANDINLAYTASTATVGVTTSCKSWTVEDDQLWLSVTPTSGTADRSITIRAQASTESHERSGYVTLKGCDTSTYLEVTQAPKPTLAFEPSTLAVGPAGTSQYVFLTTTGNWSISIPAAARSWLTASNTSGDVDDDNFRLTVAANTGAQRTATITATSGTLRATLQVTQAAQQLSVTPTTWNVPAGGASSYLTVETNLATWNYSSSASWITVTKPTDTLANEAKVTVQANTTAAKRTGTVTITAGNQSKQIAITQAVGAITVSPATWSPAWTGASAAFTVSSTAGTWQVADGSGWPTWLKAEWDRTRSAGASTLVLTAARNEGAARSYTVNLTNGSLTGTIKVTQAAAAAATLTVSTTTWAAPYELSSWYITVTTNRYNYTVTSDQSWLVAERWSRDQGNVISLAVDANHTTATRKGTVTITAGNVSRKVTVTQAAGPAQAEGFNYYPFEMQSAAGSSTWPCGFWGPYPTAKATTSGSWLTAKLISPASPPYEECQITFTANTGAVRWANLTTRVGTKVIATAAISQNGVGSITASGGLTWAAPAAGGSTSKTVTVVPQYEASLAWSATSDSSWLHATSSGMSGQPVVIAADSNAGGGIRTGRITLAPEPGFTWSGRPTVQIVVTQAAGSLSLSPASWSPAWNGATTSVQVTASKAGAGAFAVNTSTVPSWITYEVGQAVSGDRIVFTAARNTGAARSASIRITMGSVQQVFTVNQPAAAAPTLSLSNSTFAAPMGAAQLTVTVTTNQPTYTYSTDASSWITLSRFGMGVSICAYPNPTAATRVGHVTVTVGTGAAAVSKTITVTQAAGPAPGQSGSWAIQEPVQFSASGYTQGYYCELSTLSSLTITDNAAWVT